MFPKPNPAKTRRENSIPHREEKKRNLVEGETVSVIAGEFLHALERNVSSPFRKRFLAVSETASPSPFCGDVSLPSRAVSSPYPSPRRPRYGNVIHFAVSVQHSFYLQTLSSLALVFALHHYKPTPLYVMDEIDAALDFKNVSIVGHYVKDRTKDAQFIIISLRNNMFELADRLVGIYKTDNCTKSITINPGSFAVCQKTSA